MKKSISISLLLIILFSTYNLLAQSRTINGTVVDHQNVPIIGATLLVKGTQNGTVTDADGAFSLKFEGESAIVIVSSIGYLSKEVVVGSDHNQLASIRIQLEEDMQELNEVIVTGVFDRRKSIESSIAITTLDRKILDRVVPNSAAELLRYVPGVFTNTSRGEIFNSVAVRGMVLGGGYTYVSIQEDGLPIVPAPLSFAPDGFLRADATLGRLEAVRGGTASILGANAPGGIFNYISKTGSDIFSGEMQARFGLEGNGKNPYYRLDGGFGGPFGGKDKTLTWFLGGHYRHADGAKHPGYPLSRGGQAKGNIVKKYKNGSLQIGLKYLHDRTAQFEYTPTIDFEKPRPAGDFSNTTSTLNPLVRLSYPASVLGGLTNVEYDSRNLNLYKEIAPSINWEHRFGDGWMVQNAFRFSKKSLLTNSSLIVYPFSVDKFFFYAVNGWLGKFGTYRFYNPQTQENYGTVAQEFDVNNPFFPFKFNADLHLPGAEVQPNSVFYNPIGIEKSNAKDWINQFSVKKHFNRTSLTAGVFHSTTKWEQYIFPPAAQGFGTLEDKPRLVGIEFTPADAPNGPKYQLTDPNGIGLYGVGGVFFDKATLQQTALFFGHNWDITNRLNLDWGFRYERFNIAGRNVRTSAVETTKGGVDGDSTTLYDNDRYLPGDYQNYESPLNTYAFSAGLNYRLQKGLAVFARYSNGSKTPNSNVFYASGAVFKIEPQRIVQIEGGVKMSKANNSLMVTPFYSALDKIPQQDRGQNEGQPITFYATPKLYNKTHTIGIEIEGNYTLNEHWSIRASGMLQRFTADKFQFYDPRQDGPADDTLIDRSNKQISYATPVVIFNITPTFTHKKLFVSLNWYHMGRRAANSSETFFLPAYSQFDWNAGYEITPKIRLQASVNNLLNALGIMDWTAPTSSGLPFETFDIERFSPERRAADPNAIYYTTFIQPRSFWVSVVCRFF
ncbi:MAG: TonB-dependent receptor [Saprospiraceae bacterium]|nr:TonB-dependent receptor [Saprospiraceae bacterium]